MKWDYMFKIDLIVWKYEENMSMIGVDTSLK